MADAAAQVRMRQIELPDATSTDLDERDDGSTRFVATDAPPPVGTILEIGDASFWEVTHVVEVPETDPRGNRGAYVRQARGEALERHRRVGTERFAPGEREASEGPAESDARADESAGSEYAVPAPVVEPEPSQPIGLDDDGSRATSSGGKKRKGRRRT